MLKITVPSTVSRSEFYEKTLGAKLRNRNWSWGASAPVSNCVSLNVWIDRMGENGAEVYWKQFQTQSPGKPERKNHIDAIRDGALGIGILCEVVNPNVSPRKIKTFDVGHLLLFGKLHETGSHIYAQIIKRFPISELPALINHRTVPSNSAIDDISAPPIGSQHPSRKITTGYQYERDDKVRRHVIDHAKNRCEYCSKLGFLLPNGRHYLEAHHIIGLAKQGPDTVNNVIALCPSDHREVHYGANAETIEKKMIAIIKNRKI